MSSASKQTDLGNHLWILIANREPELASTRAKTLQAIGYEATIAWSLAQAHDKVTAAPYSLILLDARWVRDGLDGFAALREAAPEAIWVVTCPPEWLEAAVSLLRFGAAEILVEPLALAELQEAIARIVERTRQQQEGTRMRALIPLYEVSQAFMLNLDLSNLLQRVVESAVAATGAQRGSLMLIDRDRQDLTIQAAVGMPPEVVAAARERVGRGIAGWVARTGVPLVINNEEDIPPFVRSSLRGGMAYSAVCLPLTVKGEIIGVINLTKTVGRLPFTRGDAEMLSVLAGQAAIAIENARLFDEMQRAYADLRQLDDMKSEFINIAAHELRTPVAVILGYSALLNEFAKQEAEQEYTEAILRSARRLQELTDDLFDLEHLRTWQPDTSKDELSPIAVYPLVAAVVAEYQPQAQERQLSLKVAPPPGPASVDQEIMRADEVKMTLILRHLLSNAVKFSPIGGRVVVAVEPSEEEITIAVADTGAGVAPEKRRHLFEPFYQAEPSLTRHHSGMGLGLSIARRLAELQGGRIWLEDRAGFGAVFCVALPRVV